MMMKKKAMPERSRTRDAHPPDQSTRRKAKPSADRFQCTSSSADDDDRNGFLPCFHCSRQSGGYIHWAAAKRKTKQKLGFCLIFFVFFSLSLSLVSEMGITTSNSMRFRDGLVIDALQSRMPVGFIHFPNRHLFLSSSSSSKNNKIDPPHLLPKLFLPVGIRASTSSIWERWQRWSAPHPVWPVDRVSTGWTGTEPLCPVRFGAGGFPGRGRVSGSSR